MSAAATVSLGQPYRYAGAEAAMTRWISFIIDDRLHSGEAGSNVMSTRTFRCPAPSLAATRR